MGGGCRQKFKIQLYFVQSNLGKPMNMAATGPGGGDIQTGQTTRTQHYEGGGGG